MKLLACLLLWAEEAPEGQSSSAVEGVPGSNGKRVKAKWFHLKCQSGSVKLRFSVKIVFANFRIEVGLRTAVVSFIPSLRTSRAWCSPRLHLMKVKVKPIMVELLQVTPWRSGFVWLRKSVLICSVMAVWRLMGVDQKQIYPFTMSHFELLHICKDLFPLLSKHLPEYLGWIIVSFFSLCCLN